MMKNEESNAEYKGLDADHLVVDHHAQAAVSKLTICLPICSCFDHQVHGTAQGRWTLKSAQFLLDMLKNAESNAE